MTAADRIRARITEKREEYAEYLAHARLRLREEDLHGLWDCGANASEVSNYIDGAIFALEVYEANGRDAQRCPFLLNGVRCVRVAGHGGAGGSPGHMFAPDEEPSRP